MNNKIKLQKYWFYLDSYVHVDWKQDSALLYNPLNGHIQEYINEPEIVKILKRLHHPRNLRVIPLTTEELKNPPMGRLVRDVRHAFMGDLVEQSRSNGKPVQMQPMLKVQRDADKMKRETSRTVGEDMLKYINELNLYLNNQCHQSCSMCRNAFHQFLCCTKHSRHHQLTPNHIKYLLDHLSRANLDTINLLGGNPLEYKFWDQLKPLLRNNDIKKVLYCHYKNLAGRAKDLQSIANQSWQLKTLVDFPLDEAILDQVIEMAGALKLPATIHFIVKSEAEFEQAETVITRMRLETVQFHPFYDGTNEDFFREGVFLDRRTIAASGPTIRDIHARKMINPLQFGNLTVLSNQKVYANINVSPLGTLGTDSLYDMVFKEMRSGKSWRRTRAKAKPCRNCLFNALCPPLSNYEYALGRNNLCDIDE